MWKVLIVSLLCIGVVFPLFIVPAVIYVKLLTRRDKNKWGRECSAPEDPEYLGMFDEGKKWRENYASQKTETSIRSDGFCLVGEYFDFGSKKAVIIVPGRTESLLYGCYFAEPYRREGYNVLVIDNRSHGLSDGKVNSLGYREYKDLLLWAKLLHETYGNETVIFHGICIGASTSLFALTAPSCPDYIRGMVSEGMFTDFHHTFRNHMIAEKHPNFPFTPVVMLYIRLFSHANVVTDGPIRRIPKLKQPILFLHSREDIFSLPQGATELYQACSAQKTLVWFEKGAHSRIRANNKEKYDASICEFLRKNEW